MIVIVLQRVPNASPQHLLAFNILPVPISLFWALCAFDNINKN